MGRLVGREVGPASGPTHRMQCERPHAHHGRHSAVETPATGTVTVTESTTVRILRSLPPPMLRVAASGWSSGPGRPVDRRHPVTVVIGGPSVRRSRETGTRPPAVESTASRPVGPVVADARDGGQARGDGKDARGGASQRAGAADGQQFRSPRSNGARPSRSHGVSASRSWARTAAR